MNEREVTYFKVLFEDVFATGLAPINEVDQHNYDNYEYMFPDGVFLGAAIAVA